MNKIFKVIWSKSRNCYVVASELAKGTSKSTSTGRMAKRAVLAAVAALLISPLGAGYVSAVDYVTVKDTSGTEQTVYTKDGVDAQLGEYAKNTTVSKNTSDISDLKTADEQLQTNIDNEAAAREAADTKLDSRTSAVETKTASLTRVADANSTSINESMTYKGNQYSATLQVNGSGAQIGVVNNEAAGLANDGGTAYTEYRARTGAIVSKATNDISSTSSNGQIIDTAGDTAGEYSQVATAKSTGKTFTYNDGTSSSSTTIKGNAISTGSIDATGNISAASVDVSDKLTAGSASVTNSISVGHNANVGGAVNAGSLNSRGNLNVDGNALVKGTLTSQSTINGNEIVSQTNITAKNKVVGMQGVVDNTLTSGNYVTAGNTVGENIVALDTQAKANADAIEEEARKRKYSVTNLENADKQLQTNIDNEAAAREAKDNELNERITNEANAIHETTNKLQDDLNTETTAREAADNELNERITNEANAIHETTNQLQSDLNTETAAREAGDTALNERITNVKEYLEKQTSDNYVSKTDAAVQDGAIVKAAKTIGENVTNLDAALAKETAARIGADAAQDKVIQQVNQNMVDGFNTINTNMANGFAALNQADANEAAAREAADAALDSRTTALEDKTEAITYDKDSKTVMVDGKLTATEGITDGTMRDGKYVKLDKYVGQNLNALDQGLQAETSARVTADTKLVEATNGGLSLGDGNVLQTNTTTIDAATGEVTTSKTDANEMILNKGKDNQITLNENGIKVGTNSTVVDKDGVYTGGDTYSEAKAAMSADGKIKGANGAFTVDENGNVTSKATITGETVTDGKGASMSNGTVTGKTLTDGIATITNGNINTSGTVTGGTVTSTGNISALGDIHAGGAITGASASIQGALTAGSATITGDLTAGGAIQGKSLSDGTATMQNGNLTGVKNLSAETITTSGDATIGGDLTVNGKLNVDEIDLTKSGIVGDNNVTASTKVAAGEITSYKKATSTKDGSEKEAAFDYDENGTSTWAKATDADGNWKKSTLTVEGSDVTSKVVDSDKNSNESKQTSTESSDVVKDADGNTSTFSQRVKDILQEIKNASGDTLTKVEQTDTAITSQIGDGSAVKSVMDANGIANTATGGTISNSAANISNTTTGNMTNTVGGNLIDTIMGTSTTTVTGKVTEDYKSDLSTKVGGNQTTIVTGNQTNNVSGSKNETVKGSVTEKYGSQATTVDGDQSTNIGGNQTTVVAKDQTNTVSGNKTETVKGAVNETYGSQTTKVNGDQSTTVTGKQTNSITGDQVNTIGGNQTTTVTGDSSLTAENITNEAKNKITNKALDVETDASSSIVSKVSNEYGSNTFTQLSYQTTEEMSQADGKKASYLRGAAEEKSQLTDGDKKTTVDTIAGQTNTNITDGINTSNDLQKADQIASSVTDGTNTTVVNQDAKSLASSITDGTKANNTNNTVDKSEQLIKANDTQYSATTKTATKMEDALVSGSNIIDVIKGLDAAGNPLISSAVTDGTTITGISQNAKDINLSAAGGTITNDAQNITNKAAETLSNSAKNIANTTTEDMTNTIGKNLKTTVGGDMSTEVTGSQSTTVKGNQSNTVEGTLTETVTGKATENYNGGLETTITGEEKHTVNGDQTNTITGKQATTVTGDSSLSAKNITNTASEKITNQIGDGSAVKSEMTADGITNTAEGGTIYNKSKDILNEASGDILNFADGEIGNSATKITNLTGDNTVTSDTNGTTFENTAHSTAVKEGTVTKTTISGNTITTGEAVMDYADVMKDLGVRGNAAVDGNTTLGKEGAETTLTVNSTSTFNKDVTMKENATVAKDLSVGGNASVSGSVTASSYKVGDKTYISESGINANDQKVVNVAPGRIAADSKDAINGSQLYQTNERVTSVENRVGTVENRVDKLDSRVDKVGANAAALANLHPLEFDADSKWNIAAAVGGYKGETATAIGAFYRPNENVMVNVSSSFGTGENMYGGGISLRIGQGGNKARRNATNGLTEREKAMQKQIDSLTSRLDALLSVINPNMSKDFPDVPENHWAYEAVSRLAGNGVIQGYEDGKYHGDRTMTRYEMAEIIYNALSKGAKAEKKLVEEFKPELQAMAAQKKA